MKQKQAAGEFMADGPDGWAVVDPDEYHFFVNVDPPRPGSFLHLLKSDVRSWRVLLFWATGITFFTLGVVAVVAGMRVVWLWLALPGLVVAFAGLRPLWQILSLVVWSAVVVAVATVGAADRPQLALPGLIAMFGGARSLALLLRMFRHAHRNIRWGPLLLGEIHSLGQYYPHTGCWRADARFPGGRSIPVSVRKGAASAVLDQYGRAEVLLLADPDRRSGCVIGMRPVARDRAEAEADTAQE
jgi:hypothetical protein